jgi:putative two-component system hydrogenase maturation factor HypX/HoxX
MGNLYGSEYWTYLLPRHAGDIWASASFPMRNATKGSLYRNEVTEAAVEAVLLALDRVRQTGFSPLPLEQTGAEDRWRPPVTQAERRIDWQADDSATVLRKINSGDGFPGVRETWFGRELYLYDARAEPLLRGRPGELVAKTADAVCVATVDAAVWIGHLTDRQSQHPFKLPAARVLADEIDGLPDVGGDPNRACRALRYREADGIGYLAFDFHNGAMGSEQCRQLRAALAEAKSRNTRIIVLEGGSDYWSNGIHLNHIEAADSAADESWRNINAIDDLALEIIDCEDRLLISAMRGNAGAGGVFLARAADLVWARRGIILNPHYKDMGNLYGSEYWTYLLPRHAGEANAERITQARLPMGTREARALGLVDRVIESSRDEFSARVHAQCLELLAARGSASLDERLRQKRERRAADEARRPLAAYREEELNRMRQNFYGFDPSYHIARYNFVYKVRKSRTPLTIARHRRREQLRRVS